MDYLKYQGNQKCFLQIVINGKGSLNLHALIYHTPNCMKCRLTSNLLKIPVKMEVVDRIKNVRPDIIQHMDELNMKSAPLVQVLDENENLIDEWNDFKPDRIKSVNDMRG